MDAESQLLAEKDAEIERLLTKSEKDKNTLLVSLEAAIKEVERLKGESAIKESAIRELCAIARDKNQLLTKCADALARQHGPRWEASWRETDLVLIQCVREAMK